MLNPSLETFQFSLSNFKGSLDLLLHLIQRDEIDVCSIPIRKMLSQLIDHLSNNFHVDTGADALVRMSGLLLLKSRKLLPVEKSEHEDENLNSYQFIQQLLEYCQFKEVALELSRLESEQQAFFPRGTIVIEKTPSTGLEKVKLEELTYLFAELLKNKSQKTHIIKDEEWHVAPKIAWLRSVLSNCAVEFSSIFDMTKPRGELIVIFLALLELIKNHEAIILSNADQLTIQRCYV